VSGVVYVNMRKDGVWIEPGQYLIPLDEFRDALAAIRLGTYRVRPVGRSPVIAAILGEVIPDVAAEIRAQAAKAAQQALAAREREAARIAREQQAAEAEAQRRAKAMARLEAERLEAEQQDRNRRRASLLGQLEQLAPTDFLDIDRQWSAHPDSALVSPGEVQDLKARFVQAWANSTLPDSLDDDQARAVAATAGDVKVVARAGSGKTRTLIARSVFLQLHCGVAPREQLLLAFNRKAALEIRERLAPLVGDDLPHVMTFHALAYSLVHPDENLLFDDPRTGGDALSREVQEVIDEHIRSEEHRDLIREVMLAHFREDWERIENGRIELPIDEFLAYRRALPRETLAGETVKSFGERLIANTLFENGVPYAYERSHRWNGVNYKPDFTIPAPGGGIVVEYFGLEGDPDYDDMSAAKRAYWRAREGWTLLEYSPNDIARSGVEAFRVILLADLAALGVVTRARSEEEIWQEVRRRAIDNFTKTMTSFVGRCRKRDLAVDGLAELTTTHVQLSRTEGLFLDIAQSVYGGYLRRLQRRRLEDFDGLIWRAARAICAGETAFARNHASEHGDLAAIRYVLVDEFQDFSAQFYELLAGIRLVSPSAQFFCVGDDWQAINGFAGADLKYFTDFTTLFRNPVVREITTNYRSAPAVVHAGNSLMHGLGVPARAHPSRDDPAPVRLARIDEFAPSPREQELHSGDDLTPAVLRLARHFLDNGQAVALLSRRNSVRGYVNYSKSERRSIDGLDRFLGHVRSFLPEEDRERVSISTTHGYKGLEQDAVIVLDALEGSYPLIHPSWVFMRLFGDRLTEIEAAERRLFYVAMTRARRSLVILTERRRRTPYLADVEARVHLVPVDWDSLPPVNGDGEARLEVRVYDAYDVRDALKGLGYRWNAHQRYWARSLVADGFDAELLLTQDWTAEAGRVVVLTESGEILVDHPTRDGNNQGAVNSTRDAPSTAPPSTP
jgi:DNA helicase-4